MKITENGNISGKKEFWDKFTDDTLERIAEKVEGTITVPSPYINDDGYWMVWDSKAKEYVPSNTRAEGYTPQKGTDYWTEEDKSEVINEALEKIDVVEKVFYVRFWSNGQYHGCNKTNAEIVDAINAGKLVNGIFSRGSASQIMCVMVSYYVNSKYIDVDTDIGVSMAVSVEYAIFEFFDGISVFTVEFDPQTEQWCVNGSQPIVPEVPTTEEIVNGVLEALPDADTMTFPLEETISEVSEE